jgi:RNA polymerase sigma factor (sigma-70 family)
MDESLFDDVALIADLRSPEPGRRDRAFDLIYKNERLQNKVWHHALQRGLAPEEAEEIYHDVLIDFAEAVRAERFKLEKGCIEAYIMGIVKHKISNQKRNFWNRLKHMLRWKEHEKKRPEKEARAEEEQERLKEIFQLAGRYLPPKCKKILPLHFEDLPESEILAEMGYASIAVVRNTISTCRRALRELIKEFPKLLE